MTVNKITTPPSQKGVIDKINEVIDNLGGQGTAPVWGNISGTLSNQTDLQSALDDKQDVLGVLNSGNNISITKEGINLPSGYTQVNGVTNSSGTRVNTGFKYTTDDIIYELTVKPTGGSWYIFQSRIGTSGTVLGISGASNGSRIQLNTPSGALVSDITRTTTHIYHIVGSLKNGEATLIVEDLTNGNIAENTRTYTFSEIDSPICVFANANQTVAAGNTVYRATLTIGGETVMDYVPAVYNNTVGFYDLISQTFKTATNGTLTAGETISSVTKINFINTSGYITGITSSDVTTALGYTPYNATNPNGYITASALTGYATEQWVTNQGYTTNVGTVTSVNNTSPDANGNVTLTIDALPSQTDNSGKFLTTDGTDANWTNIIDGGNA